MAQTLYVFNQTRQSFLSLGVSPADTHLARLRGLLSPASWDAMLSHVPVPPENIHPVRTENVTPEQAASAYERELKSFYGADTLEPARRLFEIQFIGQRLRNGCRGRSRSAESLQER